MWWYLTVCTDNLTEKPQKWSESGAILWSSFHWLFGHTIQSSEITAWNVFNLPGRKTRKFNFFLVYVRHCVNTYSAWITTDLSFTGYLYYCSLGKLSTWRIMRLTRDPHSRHLHHGWLDWIKIKTPLNTQFWMRWDLFNLKLLM